MPASDLKEATEIGTKGLLADVDYLLRQIRDFLAHSPARYCQQNNRMDEYDALVAFTQYLVKDIPAIRESASIAPVANYIYGGGRK